MRIDAATGWSLGLWFVLGLVPTVGQSMGWHALANHQGLAAWIQALGSIGAIVSAVLIASAQARSQQQDQREEAADKVAALVRLIEYFKDSIGDFLRERIYAPSVQGLPSASNLEDAHQEFHDAGKAIACIQLQDLRSEAEVACVIVARRIYRSRVHQLMASRDPTVRLTDSDIETLERAKLDLEMGMLLLGAAIAKIRRGCSRQPA